MDVQLKKDTNEAEVLENGTNEAEVSENGTIEETAGNNAETTEKSGEEAVEESTLETVESSATEPIVDTKLFDKKKKAKKIVSIISLSFVGLIAIVYVVMAVLCMKRFYPGTVINGYEVSMQDTDMVNNMLVSVYPKYSLDIKFRQSVAVISDDDIGMKVSFEKALNEILESQNPWLWPVCIKGSAYDADLIMTYDDAKLDAKLLTLEELDRGNMTKSKNPEIRLAGDAVKLEEGEKGTEIDADKFNSAIRGKIEKMDMQFDVDIAGCYVEPQYALDSDKVKKCEERMNKFLSADIVYLYGEYEIPITKENIYSMIDVDADYNVSIKRSSVQSFLEEFSGEHDTLETERRFRTTKGDYVNVLGKKYGWKIDIEEEVDALYIDIINGRSVKREPDFSSTGYCYGENNNDIGITYAEVDLTNQKVYMYFEGNLVFECDCVSGNVSAGHRTPGGLYSITYMERNTVLRGADYASPVSYWMPFNGGIGFHDANWRSSFGGTIYLHNGSHGCVNLPPSRTGELYSYLSKGVPVVCYWRE